MTIKQQKHKSPVSAFLPVLGLIMALCFGFIAWVIAPYLVDWAIGNIQNFDGNEINPLYIRLMFAAFIFFILMAFGSFLVSLGRPKKKSVVKDQMLKKERDEVRAEQRARKRRKQEMQRMNRPK